MGGNVGHEKDDVYFKGTMKDIQAFDALPSAVRKVIASAPYQYSAESALNTWSEWLANPELEGLTRDRLAHHLANGLKATYASERQAKTPLDVNFAGYKAI